MVLISNKALVMLRPYIDGFKHVLDHKNITKFDQIGFGRCSVNPIIQYWKCLFFINIFRHLKLEIALAIPASNDEKYKRNSAAEGLTLEIIITSIAVITLSVCPPKKMNDARKMSIKFAILASLYR